MEVFNSPQLLNCTLLERLLKYLVVLRKKHDDSDSGIRMMKANVLASPNRHYGNIETNSTLTVPTLLDPHFKDNFFPRVIQKLKLYKH